MADNNISFWLPDDRPQWSKLEVGDLIDIVVDGETVAQARVMAASDARATLVSWPLTESGG